MDVSPVRYARSGTTDIAYDIGGAGPIDLVYVAGFISHLDLAKELSPFAALLGRLRRFARVLAFDKRGTGCSGRDIGFGSLAERSDDIRAVMDDAGWSDAYLLGVSEGGPLSALFAATYPERVRGLALYGSFACLLPPEDPTSSEFDVERFLAFVEAEWGTGRVIGAFTHAPYDESVVEPLARYERGERVAEAAAAILRSNMEIDARSVLPAISVPTLVVHRTGDPVCNVNRGRELAAGIADARFVELDGDMHCGWNSTEWAPVLDLIEEFMTGQQPGTNPTERLLATVLFSDIVDSTKRASAIGDHAWRALLDEHDSMAERVVATHSGRVVKHTGDGVFATFDGPARAVQCAKTLVAEAAPIGLELRVGLHTGEVEVRGNDIGGIAVHIGARIAARAGARQIFVSRTVRDLVFGSDLEFEDAGSFELKGVPDAWQLYAAV